MRENNSREPSTQKVPITARQKPLDGPGGKVLYHGREGRAELASEGKTRQGGGLANTFRQKRKKTITTELASVGHD